MNEQERHPVLDFTEAVGLGAILDRLDQLAPMLDSVYREQETNDREYRELLARRRRIEDEQERLREKAALLAGIAEAQPHA